MQSLDIISINLWHILISLANLIIIFLIVKKFLFKPVKELFAKRQAELDHQYAAADAAEKQAMEHKEIWEKKLQTANDEADAIIQEANDTAKCRRLSYRAARIRAKCKCRKISSNRRSRAAT